MKESRKEEEEDIWIGPKPLEFTSKVLQGLALWPKEGTSKGRAALQRLFLVLSLCPSATTLVTGAWRRLGNGGSELVTLLDHVVGLGGLVAMVYMGECFARNLDKVRGLVRRAVVLPSEFGAQGVASRANKRVEGYAKAVLGYGVAGNVCYALAPLLTAWTGRCSRSDFLESRRDPCGLIVRVWYPWDMGHGVRFLIAYLLQLYTCVVISAAVLALSMAPVGLLANAVALLEDLQRRLRIARPEDVPICLRYHNALIGIAKLVAKMPALETNVRLMRWLQMWPASDGGGGSVARAIVPLVPLFSATAAILGDFVIQLGGKCDDVLDLTENMTAIVPLVGTMYLHGCFLWQRRRVTALVTELRARSPALRTEHRASLYTRLFMLYAVIGNLCYLTVPYTNLGQCRASRAASRYSSHIPCELITRFRLPFKYEESRVLVAIAVLVQLYCCLTATVITVAITMFLVALLMYAQVQARDLHDTLLQQPWPADPYKHMRHVLVKHRSLNRFAGEVRAAFSSMMLMHVTLTSFEISVLGFEVLMVTNRTDSLRFGMHLAGWLVLLLLVCGYGQRLIDESSAVARAAYNCAWYDAPVPIQKDLRLLMLRAQRPLTLSAASLGVMSLETFLAVLSTAYSYFTLLLNLKNN